MDEILLIVLVVVLILAGIGVNFLAVDYRNFNIDIVRVCNERGFIQNKDIRVFCQVEPVK